MKIAQQVQDALTRWNTARELVTMRAHKLSNACAVYVMGIEHVADLQATLLPYTLAFNEAVSLANAAEREYRASYTPRAET